MITRDVVAKEAGVCPSTVSRVINDTGAVSPDLTIKVRKAIEKLGYKPNVHAQSLAGGSSKHVGVIVEDLVNPFFAEVIHGMEDLAYESGYIVSAFSRSLHLDKIYRHIVERNLDGLYFSIVIDAPMDERWDLFGGRRIHTVNNPIVSSGPYIEIKMDAALKQLAELLALSGRNRIGYIGRHEKGDIFRKKLKETGLPTDEARFVYTDRFDAESGYELMKNQLLNTSPLPDAVFLDNDLVAFGAMHAIIGKGLRIPQDIAVAGCDDTFISAHSTPTLTTIRTPKYEMGKLAMELLLTQIKSGQTLNEQRTLEADLIIRGSI